MNADEGNRNVNENYNINDNSFEKLCKIQRLLKIESALKELCNLFFIIKYNINVKYSYKII